MQLKSLMADCSMQWDQPQGMPACQVVIRAVCQKITTGCRA